MPTIQLIIFTTVIIATHQNQFRYPIFAEDPDAPVDIDLRYASHQCKNGITHNRELQKCNNDLVSNYKKRMAEYVMEWRGYVTDVSAMKNSVERAQAFACCTSVHLKRCFNFACSSNDIAKINDAIKYYHEKTFKTAAPNYPLKCRYVDEQCQLECPGCHFAPANPIDSFHTNAPDSLPQFQTNAPDNLPQFHPNSPDISQGGQNQANKPGEFYTTKYDEDGKGNSNTIKFNLFTLVFCFLPINSVLIKIIN